MEQHPIPRQITTFEFKLIGFMTLRQFIYLIIFFPTAFIVFKLVFVPVLNFFLATIVACVGLAFAFFPVNERPLDVWIKNLFKKLSSPTQYFYRKENPPIHFFSGLYFTCDPHQVFSHIESQEKLNNYLSKSKQTQAQDKRKQTIKNLFQQPTTSLKVNQTKNATSSVSQTVINQPVALTPSFSPPTKLPFFTGLVKNNKKIPLPGILIYVKDKNNNSVRLLKTNPHGVFATYNSLPPGFYTLEIKDPNNTYFFDTMKIEVTGGNITKAFEIFSKELL